MAFSEKYTFKVVGIGKAETITHSSQLVRFASPHQPQFLIVKEPKYLQYTQFIH